MSDQKTEPKSGNTKSTKQLYECLVLFKPHTDIDEMEGALKQFEKTLTDTYQGDITQQDRMGRKRLSYPIKKFKDAFMYVLLMKMPKNQVQGFRNWCLINDNIVRIAIVARDEELMKQRKPRVERPERPERGERFGGGGGGGFRGGGGGGRQHHAS